ncbi:hypothetical protein TraAM80_02477 [Trypanosoma rangeli]|uniref:FYVE-type domain-containing protein n=1 Tax=Trypanosoma rangeli TaxID=5698 RepID=A0A3S5IRU2_TRYRA|nr:uncharacterized protein TraAM80_02477 [Trypanosoma rangeli]RNF08845.1 hypothetical protein TraAM80_02477 [Trypanosoma rangeli]|eukprot:RNF08845.1 hypothetical protein TraAM80_02477 [Trypanosoma rangeli]
MQRYHRNKSLGEPHTKQLKIATTGSNSISVGLSPSQRPSAMGGVFHLQRCTRCDENFRVEASTVKHKYTCWRCGCPVCRQCRVPRPQASEMCTCILCVRPVSFIWLFQKTYHGIQLLLSVVEFCDPQAARIMRFFFPAAAFECTTPYGAPVKPPVRQQEALNGRQLIAKEPGAKVATTGSAGTQRRALVTHSPSRLLPQRRQQQPGHKLSRAKTAFRRNSLSPQEQQQQKLHRNRAQTPNDMHLLSPPRPFPLLEHKLNNGNASDVPAERLQAQVTTKATAHCDSQGLITAPHKQADEDDNANKFSRIYAIKQNGGVRDNLPRVSDTQVSSIPSVSGSRSDSPPPRFPSFSKFLDEQEAALLLHDERHPQPQQEQYNADRHVGVGANNLSNLVKPKARELEVVELGARPAARLSTWTASPNPVTPRPTKNGGVTGSGESNSRRRRIFNPPPRLRVTSTNAPLSISQRVSVGDNRRRTTPTTMTTTTKATTPTAARSHLVTAANHINYSSHPTPPHPRSKATPVGGSSNNVRPISNFIQLHTSRGLMTRSTIPTRVTTPRPFASGSLASGVGVLATGKNESAASLARRGTQSCQGKLTTRNPTANNRLLERNDSRVTSPRFARKSTSRTLLTERGVPPTFRTPLASREATRLMPTSSLTARFPTSKRSHVSGNTTPSCARAPLVRTGTVSHVRNVTPRCATAHTPLQRIASTRLLPSGDCARRYLPTQTAVHRAEPQGSAPFLMVHLTRQPKSTVTNVTETTPEPARVSHPIIREELSQACYTVSEESVKE